MDALPQDEQLILVIDKIKNSGAASVSYWTIAFTDKAVYFCDLGKNYLPMGYGVILDVMLSRKSKNLNGNIATLLEKSNKFYRFSKDNLSEIKYKKGFFRNQIFIYPPNGFRKIKLNNKKFKIFLENLSKYS